MTYERKFIDAVKDATDMLELAEEYTEMHKASNNTWQGQCPHPKHNDSTPSFTVFTDTNSWNCFGCNLDSKYGSDCIGFIQWITEGEYSWQDALLCLANRAGVPIPDDKNKAKYDKNYRMASKYHKDLTEEALEYLNSRGITDKEIIKWHIGYDKETNRIVFPLYSKSNQVVGFNKRVLDNRTKGVHSKYINSKNSDIFNKSTFLYGIHYIKQELNYIIITEGSMDVILATKYGLQNVVCTLGTTLSKQHVEAIKKMHKIPIIVYDGDEKGRYATQKAANLFMENNMYCKVVNLPEGFDLADIAIQLKNKLVKYIDDNTYTYGYSKINEMIKDYNKKLYELQLDYSLKAKEILNKIPDNEKDVLEGYLKYSLGILKED